MAKIYHVDLSQDDRDYLETILKKRKQTSEAVKRARILLAADRSGSKKWTDVKISETYEVSVRTIERLRERIVNDGLSVALEGKPREFKGERLLDGEAESKLIALRCSEPGEGRSGWTLRLLSEKMVSLSYVEHISHESVRRILKKTKLNLGK